ncbi:adenylate/guanylate cyclase domain-containing protein [Jeotgalibacillus sp. R-1-5s-1]|uniref:adenylate/guanylate cyclase domain-containing protein n=1 Tax=Jeotgalibacillus sp. R-1-5s-1 TaxID=2555897 RepID=UPI00106A7E2B|nr:adenylate/guanylate cyclase domain-containing protein [Jeotgalibacillus sp. R-1-5s-1]TFE01833.1 adenylate/guanylate cyclase domain-containing protein [Jeotgalibacillus sp. R-1-5s-1]
MKEKTYVFKRTYPIERTKAWALLSDTEQLNRLSGLFPVEFSDAVTSDKELFRFANAKALGLVPLKWREHPFEWVKEQIYSVERRYEGGPIKLLIWEVAFKDSNETLENGQPGTEITGTARFIPANLIGHAAIPTVGLKSIKEIMKYIDKYLEANHTAGFETLPSQSNVKVDQQRVSRISEKLKFLHHDHQQISILLNHLSTAEDNEVLHMQPYALADRWGFSRQEFLELFLHSVKEGLLNQEWSLMCPNCRVPKSTSSSMRNVKNQVHCDLCGVDYQLDFDRYIEMKFSIHPSVRKAVDQVYCMTGPARSPHVLSQKRVSPGDETVFYYPAFTGQVRLRLLKSNHVIKHDLEAESHKTLSYQNHGWETSVTSLNRNGGSLIIQNGSENEIIVLLENTEWDGAAVTAASVTSLQLYRDLFSNEVLSPDQQIGIESLTVLFSDLKGSTSLYEEVGDAPAYHQVHTHFNYLKDKIASGNGTIVKTIGDSVMAVFYKKEDAFETALSIQDGMKTFNREQNSKMTIKLGLYSGPVIAVNANELLDYFGRTVNMAARIQQKSIGNDLLVAATEWQELKVSSTSYTYKEELITERLSGIEDEVELVRLTEIHLPDYAEMAAASSEQ